MGKIYLKKEERELLFLKYRKIFDNESARKKVQEFQEYLINLYKKLKAEKKSDEEVSIEFKIAFENLMKKLEAQGG